MNKWTEEEKDFVIDEFKKGNTVDEIFNMSKIKRSRYAIECKLYGHIYDLLQNGSSHEEVATQFNIKKKQVKEIEQKAFEMRNKTDTKTMYTNDGGYVYNSDKSQNNQTSQNSIVDLNDIYNVNRTMNAVINFYENMERLQKLKDNKTIDEDFYKELVNKLRDFNIDKDKIINSFKTTKTSSKSSQKQEEEPEPEQKEETKPKQTKSQSSTKDDDDGTYVKKIRKRMI
jgi:hypothetical protein